MTRARTLLFLAGLALWNAPSAAATAAFSAQPASLGVIPDGGPSCPAVGAPRDVHVNVSGAWGTVDRVSVSLTLSHPFVGELRATLIAPDGAAHVLFARTGALLAGSAGDASPLNGLYIFSDNAPGNFWNAAAGTTGGVPPGPYRTSAPGGTLAGGAQTLLATVFDDLSPNGTWIVRLEDGCAGNVGQVTGAVLTIEEQLFPTRNGVGAGPIPDAVACGVPGAPRDTTFDFSTVAGSIQGLEVGLALTHTAVGDLRVELIAPNGRSHVLMSRTGAGAVTDRGDDTNLNGLYAFREAGADWWAANAALGTTQTLPSGAYRTARGGGPGSDGAPLSLETPFAGTLVTGIWTVRVWDLCPGETGSVDPSYLHVALTLPYVPGSIQPPSRVRVDRVSGGLVTLRWQRGFSSVVPTAYLVEGGVTPGQPIAALPTGSGTTAFTFAAPPGSFQIRVRAVDGAQTSLPSIEIPLHVGAPLVPSPPAPLLGAVQQGGVALSWQPTFSGGEPAGFELDVTGAVTATVPLGVVEHFAVPNVPPGFYTFRVRAVNAYGSSAPSAPLTLAVTGGCSGPPLPPANILASVSGATLQFVWDLPASGAAIDDYLIDVASPAFTGQVPIGGRALSAAVPPGAYTLRFASRNACGTSPFTSPTTLTVP